MADGKCKICGSTKLIIFVHTAKCQDCKVLLYYPYPEYSSKNHVVEENNKVAREISLRWYAQSSFYNHINFTNMLRFVAGEDYKGKKLDVLDYGGGGGQFALICKSHFPESAIFITDINDGGLLCEWKSVNIQIPFRDFSDDRRRFDLIFLNDVFEHLSDPLLTLKQLSNKLRDNGKIFIDTPKQFWIYPFAKVLSRSLYKKILNGTVSTAHLQIWSKKSFELVVQKAGLSICKYKEVSEYTMPAGFYIHNMGIKNPLTVAMARVFYSNAKWLAKNKIMSVLSPIV